MLGKLEAYPHIEIQLKTTVPLRRGRCYFRREIEGIADRIRSKRGIDPI